MFKKALCLMILLMSCGCDSGNTVRSIKDLGEPLAESYFELRFPQNWKITSQIDTSLVDHPTTTFFFRHPGNRKCYISVEIVRFHEDDNTGMIDLTKIASSKIRNLRNSFAQEKYIDFSFKTFNTTLAGQDAIRVFVQASRSNVNREATSYVVGFRNQGYIISYQWFDNWSNDAKKIVKEAIGSFRLLK
ncbi:MAG: hypothetical protein WC676_01085 [Candidatus Omnitrophota bacterium]